MKSLLLTFSRPGIATAALKSGPEDVKIERDLTDLAPERKEKLDLYQPSERAPGTLSPAVVIIHGGGWVGGDKGANHAWPLRTAKFDHTADVVNFFDRHLKAK